ncbi:MAG TPA: hypothetical protein VLL73_03285 [Desulfurivibrionaceae bacterium]|nr:hypothetical protein [Desulfurivibrionaceae bacterium]
MNPAALIPSPDPLQVPWGWFQFLLLLTFFLHMLAMNIMIGWGIISLIKQMVNPARNHDVCHGISGKITYALAFTVNFGVAPLLFLQVLYGHFIYSSSIIMGACWLSIIFFLIAAYGLAYLHKFRFDTWAIGPRRWLLATSLACLLLIGFFFTNNLTLMQTPAAWPAYFRHPGGFFLNLSEPTLLPRYLHFVAAAVATGGLALALLAHFQTHLPEAERAGRIKNGLAWFTYGTMVEIGIGFVFLLSLPKPVLHSFTGGNWLATALFLGALIGSFYCIKFGARERLWPATAAMTTTIILMILVRDLARHTYLAPYFHPADLPVTPQYSPMLLFFLILVLGLAIIAYMLRLAWQSTKEVQS